jgi:hypothetical protein
MLAELLSFLKELERHGCVYFFSIMGDAFIMQDRHRLRRRLGHVLYTPKEICAAPEQARALRRRRSSLPAVAERENRSLTVTARKSFLGRAREQAVFEAPETFRGPVAFARS